MENDVTYLGRIIRVDSNNIEVEITDNIPSASPIINGKIYKIGQMGTFVKITAGNVVSFGIVEAVSNSPILDKDSSFLEERRSSRFLSVNLIGEKIGNGPFEKGIGVYPTINDEVHLVTDDDLRGLYGTHGKGFIEIGKHSSSTSLGIFLNVHKLVLRHTAILGSTGSGKSNSVVAIIKRIVEDMNNSRMIIIDPHGEYSSAFPNARTFKIGDERNPLYIPFWLMNFEELAAFLVGAGPNDEARPEYRQFREMVLNEKKGNCDLKSGKVDVNHITVDSPIPFDIRKIWYQMNYEINATYNSTSNQDSDTVCLESEGNASELVPAKFTPYSAINKAPYKSRNQVMYTYEKKLLAKLRDSRFDYLFNPGEYANSKSSKDLHNLLQEWIGNKERLTILDLSNVPFEVLDVTVGVISRFIYDSMFWGRNESYTGKNRPLFIAYEEAHSYLGKNQSSRYALNAVERIFKEGRKFGVGAMVISQRPSELSETILAQVGTFVALRLTNSSDQSIVKSLAPDNMNSLINLLPSLRIGEAVIVGEAIAIPSRVRLALQFPQPDSSDPDLVEAWNREFESNEDDYKTVSCNIREKHL